MKTKTHSKKIQNANKTVSTLLIPAHYLKYYNEQCRLHKGRANYFIFILDRFASQVKSYEKKMYKGKNDKWKTLYQDQNMSLYRRNFRPNSVHWEQCRFTADSFGISICYLFVFLMELEMQGICVPKKYNSGNTINKFIQKNGKFFCCIRRVDFYPISLNRELIFRC